MTLVLGLITAIVANLLKKLVAKYGTLAIQAMVLVATVLVTWAYTIWGDLFDWKSMAIIFGTAFGYYEIFIKRFWPNK